MTTLDLHVSSAFLPTVCIRTTTGWCWVKLPSYCTLTTVLSPPINASQAIKPTEGFSSFRPSLHLQAYHQLTLSSLLPFLSQEDLRPAAGRHSRRRVRNRAVPQRRTGRVGGGCRSRFCPVWFRDRRGSRSSCPAPGLGSRTGAACAWGIFGSCGGTF